jgi:hypothetical protein
MSAESLVVVAIMGFQGFKDLLGVLVVNEVKFISSLLIFFREALGKRRVLSTSLSL